MKTLLQPRALGILFSLCFCAFLIYANIQKPRIMILHSYDKEYAWTRDVSVGIKRVLDQKPYYAVKWHYMDTKRRSDKRSKENAASAAHSVIERWEPHVIIAIDDNAQQYVVRHYVGRDDLQIIFSGMNGTREKYGYVGAKNVTGILERLELTAIKNMIQELIKKDTIKVALVTDKSSTSELVHKEVKAYNWHPLQLSYIKMAPTFADWKAAIKQANEQTDILFFTNYHTVARNKNDKQKVPPRELIGWTMANTDLPNIGGWGFFVEDGGMISTGVSPYEQGEIAARMAVDIIEKNLKAGEIAYESTRQFIAYARHVELEKAGFKLPKVYEAFARATNNYYEPSFDEQFADK